MISEEKKKRLTASRLRELLDYDPVTGIFRWRVMSNGSRVILSHQASRLAFLWMTGRWPKKLVDHKNLDNDDNSWENLREADYSQNGTNSKIKSKVSPFKGVTWDKSRKKYSSRIRVNYQTFNLGRFDTAEEAHAAYFTAAKKHFGEFARS